MKDRERERKRQWWDMKVTGYMPPREENRIIMYTLIGLIAFLVIYVTLLIVKNS